MSLKKSFLGDINTDIKSHDWLKEVMQNRPAEDTSLLMLAMDFLQSVGEQPIGDCDLSILAHGQVLVILGIKFEVDVMTLAALMLYPGYSQKIFSNDELLNTFPSSVVDLLVGASVLDFLDGIWLKTTKTSSNQIDVSRKLFLAMVNDIRTVAIKLIAQLCLMYYIDNIIGSRKVILAKLSQDLYAPLANRLGMGRLKWQLEDLSFRALNPEGYHQITTSINESRDSRQKKVEAVIVKIKQLCSVLGDFTITGRVKHFNSIFNKVNKKQTNIANIYDIMAVRIIVQTIDDCYAVLGVIHDNYELVEKEFDDYIAAPKKNGYQSIHSAIKINKSNVVEVQIRTKEMDKFAESGVASHWVYKEGGVGSSKVDNKVSWLKQLMSWQLGLDQKVNINCFNDRVFVFTPRGEIKDLVKGSTPLDFAYSVHTQVGHSCRGAKVNGKIVPLSFVLDNADRVQIITSKDLAPIRGWLNSEPQVLFTNSARSKVEHWFRRQDHDELLAKGEFLLNHAMKRKISMDELNKLAEYLSYQDTNSLFFALARHEITATLVVRKMNELNDNLKTTVHNDHVKENIVKRNIGNVALDIPIKVEGLTGIMVNLAKCCAPLPGDGIIGRVSRSRGVVVHRIHCEQVKELLSSEDKVLQVAWDDSIESQFPVKLQLLLEDISVDSELQNWLSSKKVDWTDCSYMRSSGVATIMLNLTVLVKNENLLKDCLVGLNNLPGVIKINRV